MNCRLAQALICAAALTIMDTGALAARDVVDDAGRKLSIPDTVRSYYTTSQIGIIALYCLNPDKLAGWGFALSPAEKEFIPAKYHDLPVLGVWSGKSGSGNVEEIARLHPDLIFSIGVADASQVALCERIQKQTGIPVVIAEAPLSGLGKMLRFVGSITGDAQRAEELAEYADSVVGRVAGLAARIPDDERVSVYYAEGPKGLETDPTGSFHTEVLDFARGRNVADVLLQKGYGRTAVSIEQLYQWDPEVIIAGSDQESATASFPDIGSDPLWKPIKAVKEGRVHPIPVRPFDWFDRPPSVNRLIGALWLFALLYPALADYDLTQEVQRFYKLFYRTDLSAAQAKALFRPAGGTK
jgi:iron complex transport system substrate-binding protein